MLKVELPPDLHAEAARAAAAAGLPVEEWLRLALARALAETPPEPARTERPTS